MIASLWPGGIAYSSIQEGWRLCNSDCGPNRLPCCRATDGSFYETQLDGSFLCDGMRPAATHVTSLHLVVFPSWGWLLGVIAERL